VPEGVASVVTSILEDNIRYGTGTRAALDRPAAGKTGTTDEHADAWFVGYTPRLATAVWMGYTRGEVPMLDVHGISVSGGSFPAEIWRRFMFPALEGTPAVDFPQPSQPPVFTTWERGPNALSYDPYYVAPATTETTDTAPAGGGGKGQKRPADSTPKGAGR
jgi:penicillin-binding protein 1A